MTNNSSITDWLQIGFGLIAASYALFLLRQSNREKRKQFILELYHHFYGDQEIRDVIYYVDGVEPDGRIKYQGQLEKQADKTIHYLDLVGQFIKNKSLRPRDVMKFKYEIGRILNHPEVVSYIGWLKTIGVHLVYLKYLKQIS